MYLNRIIKERRSIRSFTSEIPDIKLIEKVLETVMYVPSPVNSQPLEMVVIKSKEKKAQFIKLIKEEYLKLQKLYSDIDNKKKSRLLKSYWRFVKTIFNAPVIIAAGLQDYSNIVNLINPTNKSKNTGDIYLGAVLYNISLKAHTFGLGSCIYTAPVTLFSDCKIIKSFYGMEISAFITLGFPDEVPEFLEKRSFKHMVKFI